MGTFKRLETDYLQNLLDLEGILHPSDDDLTSERYISPVKIRQIYKNMRKGEEILHQMRKQRGSVCPQETHNIKRFLIHYLLERCYWIRYGDSQVVCDLLKMLFEVDGHLGKIFDFKQICIKSGIRRSNIRQIHYETTWDGRTLSNENVQPFHYFLEHANKMKTLFDYQRLTELYFAQNTVNFPRILILPPCSKTFIIPELLMTLMQYGLFANPDPVQEDIGRLMTGIIGVILNAKPNSACDYDEYTSRFIKTGNALLGAVPSVSLSLLFQDQRMRNRSKMTWCIVEQMNAPHLLPRLMVRCTGPQELQHLCRRTIRRVLYENWMLPRGIIFLPLPTLVKEYINLQCDFVAK